MNGKAMKQAATQSGSPSRTSDFQIQLESLAELSHIAQNCREELARIKDSIRLLPSRKPS